jgi:uncharacterized protein (DUF924 family)
VESLVDLAKNTMEAAVGFMFMPDGEEKVAKAKEYVETKIPALFGWYEDRLAAQEDKWHLVGGKLSFADFMIYTIYLMMIRDKMVAMLPPVLFNYPHLKRYIDHLRHFDFNLYTRQVHDLQHGISAEERKVINQVYDFWYPVQDLNTKMVPELVTKYYNGGEKVDNECREFESWIEKGGKGELDHWAKEPYGRLSLIILLDQFSRNIYRKQAKAFSHDEKALALTKEGLEKGWTFLYSHLERSFFLMPLMHCEDKEGHEIAMVEFAR